MPTTTVADYNAAMDEWDAKGGEPPNVPGWARTYDESRTDLAPRPQLGQRLARRQEHPNTGNGLHRGMAGRCPSDAQGDTAHAREHNGSRGQASMTREEVQLSLIMALLTDQTWRPRYGPDGKPYMWLVEPEPKPEPHSQQHSVRLSKYWQHESPLNCPHGHQMIWLGSRFWICPRSGCNQIYVEQKTDGWTNPREASLRGAL
jgi:hypothetical protein